MTAQLVVCAGAGRTFGHGARAVVAVHGASCTIDASSRVALVGPSGSGKSTLLHLMAGLDSPTSGSITWPAWGTGPYRNPTLGGIVFQGPSLMPGLTAVENVAFPLLLQGISHDDAMARAMASLGLLGIASLSGKVPEELSVGQAQRVAVARVITTRPLMIFADEPTGRLDRAAGERVIDVLLESADHLQAGLVIATHDTDVARRLDVTWQMRDGELRAAA